MYIPATSQIYNFNLVPFLLITLDVKSQPIVGLYLGSNSLWQYRYNNDVLPAFASPATIIFTI